MEFSSSWKQCIATNQTNKKVNYFHSNKHISYGETMHDAAVTIVNYFGTGIALAGWVFLKTSAKKPLFGIKCADLTSHVKKKGSFAHF